MALRMKMPPSESRPPLRNFNKVSRSLILEQILSVQGLTSDSNPEIDELKQNINALMTESGLRLHGDDVSESAATSLQILVVFQVVVDIHGASTAGKQALDLKERSEREALQDAVNYVVAAMHNGKGPRAAAYRQQLDQAQHLYMAQARHLQA
ncbi:MAG: hypothetical protein Q9173_004452 [Seirophora scorigena]